MKSFTKKLVPAIVGIATVFNAVGGAYAQTAQEQYDAMPTILQDAITGLGTQQNIQFDELRPRDQRDSSFCDASNQMTTQPLEGLFTAPAGELVLTPVGSGKEAIEAFKEMDEKHAFSVNPNHEVVRIYMKDDQGKITVSRPLSNNPMGPSAQEAFDCLTALAKNVTEEVLNIADLPGMEPYLKYMKEYETEKNGLDFSAIPMHVLDPKEAQPTLMCYDRDRNGTVSIEELTTERDIQIFYYDTESQELLRDDIENSHQAYNVINHQAEWAFISEVENGKTGKILAFIAKDDGGKIMINNNIPGKTEGIMVASKNGQGEPVYIDKDGKAIENPKDKGGLLMNPTWSVKTEPKKQPASYNCNMSQGIR